MKLLKCTPLKALRQERGWSIEPVTSALLTTGGVGNIHLVSLEPGTIRGNHVHAKQSEWVVAFGGRCLAAALDADGRREERTFGPDELVAYRNSSGRAARLQKHRPGNGLSPGLVQ